LTVEEQGSVRGGEAEDLFHLRPESFRGLEEENAARISSSLRLPLSAIDMSEPLGSVNENELRVIHERLVRLHDLDLRNLILGKARDLIESLRSDR
jgi:hypothetical protein